MTDKKTEALKLALDALVDARVRPPHKQDSSKYDAAITAIREALAEQPAQQPVAWMYDTTLPDGEVIKDWTSVAHPLDVTLPDEGVHNIRPLYAAPPASKPWVGLTQENRYTAC